MSFSERLSARRAPSSRLAAPRGPLRLRPVAHAMSLAAGGLVWSAGLLQPAQAQAQAQASVARAALAAPQAYNIPAGALAPALRSLASTANLLLTFTEDQTTGKTTPGLRGPHTPQAALAALLAGTGLQATPLANGGYVLRAAPAAPAAPVLPAAPVVRAEDAALPLLTVTAKADRSGVTEGTRSYTTRGSNSIATGLNLTLRETPQSVTVITRQRMDDQGLKSVTDVLQQMTGVSSFGLGGGTAASYSWFYARGFALDNVLLDGNPIPVNLFGDSVDSIAYDSISLIRGANGLMTGSGEPSGTIALTRKRPTSTFAASGSLTLGRWDQRRVTVDVGGPLIDSGLLRGRVAAAFGEGNSWLKRYNEDEATVYGILEADVGPRSRASLSIEHGRTVGRAGGPYQLSTYYVDGSPTPFGRGDNAFSDWSFNREKRTNLTAGFEHRFSDDWSAQLQYIHSSGSSTRRFANVAGSPELDGSVGVYGRRIGNDLGPQAFRASIDGRYRLWGREHQVVFGFNGYTNPLEDHAGNVEWNDSWPDVFAWRGAIGEPDWDTLPDVYERGKQKTTQYGLFVSNRLKVLDSLSLITGARLSNWRYRYTNVDTGEVTDDRRESGVFTPYAGVVYDLSPTVSAYASYATIFQPNSEIDQRRRVLDPQDGDSHEIGLKSGWFNNRLNATLAIFQTRKNNLAVEAGPFTDAEGNPTDEYFYTATDRTKSRGWEIDVAGEVLPGWQLQAGYGRAVVRDSTGGRLETSAPKQTIKLFTSWTPASMQDLTIGGGLQAQSKIFAVAEPAGLATTTIKPYVLVSLMGRYQIDEHVSVTVNLNNVFDRVYRVDETGHDYGAPRHLQATLNYQY